MKQSMEGMEYTQLLTFLHEETEYYMQELPKMNFEYFYRFFVKIAVRYAKFKESANFNLCLEFEKCIAENIQKGILEIPLRCLIDELHLCKSKGELSGKNSREQYMDYENSFLKRPEYIKNICYKYPELLRIMLIRINQIVKQIHEILLAVERDKVILSEELLHSTDFHKIRYIDLGMSDVHTAGRTVAKLELNNGLRLIYKPRSLKKELVYQEIYNYLSEKSGLEFHDRIILDFEKYSCETFIYFKECLNDEEIKRYFIRIGIQLFICYLLDVSDIHGENLIANGEFPEFIDLEVMPGIRRENTLMDTEQKIIRNAMQNSVMSTGILPYYLWGDKEREGIIVNALRSSEKCWTPFKLPVISDGGTSDIKITYSYREISLKGSLPHLKGEIVSIQRYAEDICKGFQSAYKCVLYDTSEVWKRFMPLFKMKSRYLIRHTQQYNMYSSTSLATEFLKNTMDRIYFLHVLKKRENQDKTYSRLYLYELETMMNLEVPIYSFIGESKSLFSGDGKEYSLFFDKTARECFMAKFEKLSHADMKFQIMLIRMSIEFSLPSLIKYAPSKSNLVKEKILQEVSEEQVIRKACKYISQLSITANGKRVWFSLKFYAKTWRIEPAGMNLYDGIPGLAIFFCMVSKYSGMEQYRKIYDTLCRELFSYTEALISNSSKDNSHQTGMFVGEGSLVYAYIVLYQLSGEDLFLEYAEKLATTVQRYVHDDLAYDLLSGNAGWIVVLIKLYQVTQKSVFLDYAISVGELLWKRVKKCKEGAGWVCAHQSVPLAGMAHGNSGFIYAYAHLLEHKKDLIYEERIQSLLTYENSLYSENEGNWADLRNLADKDHVTNAWCNGGSGILLSRLKLYLLPEFQDNRCIQVDLDRGMKCLAAWKTVKNFCFCHGLAGKILIMKRCSIIIDKPELELGLKDLKEYLKIQLSNFTKDIGSIPLQEAYSTAFMSGIMGAVLVLGDMEYDILW